MRDRSQTSINDPTLIQQETIREFRPSDLDVDDLAEAIRRLLDSGDTCGPDANTQTNSALPFRRERGSYVMGSGAAEPT